MGEFRAGNLRKNNLHNIAERCALRILEEPDPSAVVVTCAPNGDVMVELAEDAAEEDIVGCYTPTAENGRWIRIAANITRDLREHAKQHGVAA